MKYMVYNYPNKTFVLIKKIEKEGTDYEVLYCY